MVARFTRRVRISAMAAIIVLGSLNMDIAAVGPRLPQPGETLRVPTSIPRPGGKGANQAYAAAKLGGAGPTAMLGRVGDDDFGRQIIASLVSVGCGVEGVRSVAGPERRGADPDRASPARTRIMVVAGANDRFAPDDIDGADAPATRRPLRAAAAGSAAAHDDRRRDGPRARRDSR